MNYSLMNYSTSPIFFDVETSGLDWNKHEIIQLSAVEPNTNDIFNERIRFDINKAESKALEINHYNKELWDEKAISQHECCEKFQSFLLKHANMNRTLKNGKNYKVSVLIGHNASKFDMFFLKTMFDRENVLMSADYRVYDSLQLALWTLPELTNYNLEYLMDYLEIPKTGPLHDSLNDVYTTINITAILLKYIDLPLPRWVKKTLKELNNTIKL